MTETETENMSETETAYPAPPAVDCADRKFASDMRRLIRDAHKLDERERGAWGRWHDRTYTAEDRAAERDPLGYQGGAAGARTRIANAVREYGRECVRVNRAAHMARLEAAVRAARAEAREAARQRNDPWAPFYP